MTEPAPLAAPILYLPVHHLAQAEACVADARAALARASEVTWVSAVGDRYRAELAHLEARVHALAAAIDHARDRLTRARWAAHAHGQL
ncbi:hypothetical protein [Demequina sp. NBRC 110056]|uniref:hypothetical protein n=1 Tax=Demequina sp. NBRC 110056 TaxID=1570345 RepID=UPI000A03569A|nr:hypothetical protein [Demequina sp. NBRC 110056]